MGVTISNPLNNVMVEIQDMYVAKNKFDSLNLVKSPYLHKFDIHTETKSTSTNTFHPLALCRVENSVRHVNNKSHLVFID